MQQMRQALADFTAVVAMHWVFAIHWITGPAAPTDSIVDHGGAHHDIPSGADIHADTGYFDGPAPGPDTFSGADIFPG